MLQGLEGLPSQAFGALAARVTQGGITLGLEEMQISETLGFFFPKRT